MNKNSKTALITVMVIQLIVAGSFSVGNFISQKLFEKNATEVKAKVYWVKYNEFIHGEDVIAVDVSATETKVSRSKYYVFEPATSDDGYCGVIRTDTVADDDIYYETSDIYRGDIVLNYELSSKNRIYAQNTGPIDFYDARYEQTNINHGNISGAPTEAYAVLRVLYGKCQIVDIYIDGIQIDEYITKCSRGEIDLTRYTQIIN